VILRARNDDDFPVVAFVHVVRPNTPLRNPCPVAIQWLDALTYAVDDVEHARELGICEVRHGYGLSFRTRLVASLAPARPDGEAREYSGDMASLAAARAQYAVQ
jgi:hypothetical protein